MKQAILAFGILGLLTGLLVGGAGLAFEGISHMRFEMYVAQHLKRAADANTIPIAREELNTALHNMEQGHLTHGSTHILWATPEQDVGFWYRNIKASAEELANLPDNVQPMERSNMLIKLRETLLDETQVTLPTGVDVYPFNRELAATIFGSISLCLASLLLILIGS